MFDASTCVCLCDARRPQTRAATITTFKKTWLIISLINQIFKRPHFYCRVIIQALLLTWKSTWPAMSRANLNVSRRYSEWTNHSRLWLIRYENSLQLLCSCLLWWISTCTSTCTVFSFNILKCLFVLMYKCLQQGNKCRHRVSSTSSRYLDVICRSFCAALHQPTPPQRARGRSVSNSVSCGGVLHLCWHSGLLSDMRS